MRAKTPRQGGRARRPGEHDADAGGPPAASRILHLQAAAGNRAVASLLGPTVQRARTDVIIDDEGVISLGSSPAPEMKKAKHAVAKQAEHSKKSLPHLGKGAGGGAVLYLQQLLLGKGFKVAWDGKFGEETAKAVKKFQAGAGLAADGKVGQHTWEALGG